MLEKNKTLSAAFLFGSGKGNKNLQSVLNEQGHDIGWQRMERLKETLEKTEIGRETLDFLKKNKTKVQFEEINAYGSYNPVKNRISLNPAFSDKMLALTFVHEARHAFQRKALGIDPENMTPETYLKYGYMIEADACAAQCVFARQMKERGDNSFVEEQQNTGYAPLGKAFEKEFASSGNTDKARNAAFMKWHDLRVKEKYTGQYLDSIAYTARYAGSRRYRLTNEKSAEEMAAAFCVNNGGKCYVENPKALETPEKLYISEYQAEKLTASLQPFMKRFCLPESYLGLDKIYIKHIDGTYAPIHDTKKKMQTAKLNPAFRSALKNVRGR